MDGSIAGGLPLLQVVLVGVFLVVLYRMRTAGRRRLRDEGEDG